MTAKPPAITGTVEQRRAAREQRRHENRARHVTGRAQQARNGRELIDVARGYAAAVSKRLTDDARRDLARAIVRVVEQADVPENRKETR